MTKTFQKSLIEVDSYLQLYSYFMLVNKESTLLFIFYKYDLLQVLKIKMVRPERKIKLWNQGGIAKKWLQWLPMH